MFIDSLSTELVPPSRDAANDTLEAVPKLPCSRLVSEANIGAVTSSPQSMLRSSVDAVASHVKSSIRNGDPPAILSDLPMRRLVNTFDLRGIPMPMVSSETQEVIARRCRQFRFHEV